VGFLRSTVGAVVVPLEDLLTGNIIYAPVELSCVDDVARKDPVSIRDMGGCSP